MVLHHFHWSLQRNWSVSLPCLMFLLCKLQRSYSSGLAFWHTTPSCLSACHSSGSLSCFGLRILPWYSTQVASITQFSPIWNVLLNFLEIIITKLWSTYLREVGNIIPELSDQNNYTWTYTLAMIIFRTCVFVSTCVCIFSWNLQRAMSFPEAQV